MQILIISLLFSGVIDTDFHDSYGLEKNGPEYQAVMESFAQMHPIGRIGQVSDCVNAIAFLAKDDSNFITGVLLVTDGGLNIKGPK